MSREGVLEQRADNLEARVAALEGVLRLIALDAASGQSARITDVDRIFERIEGTAKAAIEGHKG